MTSDYIPVDFERPTEANFQAFCDAVERCEGPPKHVHCIYNARVSAFYYRYARIGKGQPVQQAFDLMDGIWWPGGVWAAFIGETASVGPANRYAGFDHWTSSIDIKIGVCGKHRTLAHNVPHSRRHKKGGRWFGPSFSPAKLDDATAEG